jgi:flagellar biosynthesis protein FlhA
VSAREGSIDAAAPTVGRGGREVGFAIGVAVILTVLFLPIPAFLIDLGLSFSIALSFLILMVALWIKKPLDFSAFPTVLLIATLLRLSLNVATTRLILAHGNEGLDAAGKVVGGFSNLVMSGDFVIGVIIFVILITVNFLVITKGATRIAEVGARFTLDAIPGKQMAIDADLSAGLIDEREARRRRFELEQESSFFGSMDGASKFVRGDAIAGLIITAVNVFGGIVIGTTRHGMEIAEAADVFVKLSVGDGLVTQIPALIVSLAAGLVVSKGGNTGTAEEVVISQLAGHPRALAVAASLLGMLALLPGLPMLPLAALGGGMAWIAYAVPRRRAQAVALADEQRRQSDADRREGERNSVKEMLRTSEVELCLGKQLATQMLRAQSELANRVAKMRRNFVKQYGFVIPEIRLSDDLSIPPKTYRIKIHGTVAASSELRIGDVMVILGDREKPALPGDETKEPAFGMPALWVPEMFASELRRNGLDPIDTMSVMLTHLGEVVRNNLAHLLSYRDMRALMDNLEPEYKRLLDETCPSLISFSGLQAVLKLLLAERVSIRNLHLVLEAVSEIAPHARKPEAIAEHVRMRIAQQICGDLAHEGALRVLRLGNRWDLAFHQSLKRDAKGEVVEFDIDPRMIEQFSSEANKALQPHLEKGLPLVLVTTPDARPYVRLLADRLFPNLPVLSHVEIARGVHIEHLGSIS